MKYRAEVDGLRAVAVVPVIFFHAGFSSFAGGYVGVDIFFVISGYLITSIILNDLGKNDFSIAKFYERRARRILPALTLIMLFCLIYLVFFQAPYSAKNLSKSLTATILFAHNLLLLFETSNYFDQAAELKPLLHTWSLAVEEQFYIVYPLLLMVVFAFCRSWLMLILIVCGVVSFAIYLISSSVNPSFAFYSPITRAWELLLGALASLIIAGNWLRLSRRVEEVLSLLALGLLVYCLLFHVHSGLPVWLINPLSAIGTFLLIIYSRGGYTSAQILSLKPMVYVGLISYSLYLWHQPILAVMRQNLSPEQLHGPLAISVALVLVVVLALLSTEYVEKPFRNPKVINLKTLTVSLSAASAAILMFGLVGYVTFGFERLKVAAASESRRDLYVSQHREVDKILAAGWRKNTGNAGSDLAVIGDSMAGDAAKALQLNGYSVKLIDIDGSCFLALSENREACGWTQSRLLKETGQIKTVLLSSDFAYERSGQGAGTLYRTLVSKGYDVKVFGSFRFIHVADYSYRIMHSALSPKEISIDFASNLDPRNTVNDLIRAAVPARDYFDKKSLFCSNKKHCMLYLPDGKPLFYDELHLTLEGQRWFGKRLIELGVVPALKQ